VAQFERNHPSGAQAPEPFGGLCGTDKSVPFQNRSKLSHY
jgi:hypothetical protein